MKGTNGEEEKKEPNKRKKRGIEKKAKGETKNTQKDENRNKSFLRKQ